MLKKFDFNGAALRMLTLACYFLPFVFFFSTCVDGVSKSAYNKEDAIKNETEKQALEKKDLLQRATNLVSEHVALNDSSLQMSSETLKMIERVGDDWYLTPTFTSLSALGLVFNFPNTAGPVLVAISFFLSLLTWSLWRWIKKKTAFYFITVNLICVLLFMLICLMEHVSTLYGVWGLAFLLLVQLLTEIQKRKQINSRVLEVNSN